MHQINLLPWREKERARATKRLCTWLIMGVVSVGCLLMLVHMVLANKIINQKLRNHLLQQANHRLEVKLKQVDALKRHKDNLLHKLTLVQALENSQAAMVHVFYEVARVMPRGAYLTKMDTENNVLVLQGLADSTVQVSQLMRNIAASPWLHHPKLVEIKAEDGNTQRTFVLHCVVALQAKDAKSHGNAFA